MRRAWSSTGRVRGVTKDRTQGVSALLSATEAAHGQYEMTELSGVYDQDWPRWYAAYAVEHGLGELVGHDVPVDQLAAFLEGAFERFRAEKREPTDSWADWTARHITTEL